MTLEETDIEKGILKEPYDGRNMTSDSEIRADIEKEILKGMQPKGLKYFAIEHAIAAGVNGTWAYMMDGGWTYLFAGMAAVSLAGVYNAIAGVKTASRNAKRIISALNNQERRLLDLMIDEEFAKIESLESKEAKSRWDEMPLEDQLKAVAEEANLLFGYEGIRLPKIERSTKTGDAYADYSPYMKLIRVRESEKAGARTIAHEYVHHLEKIKNKSLQWRWSSFMGEGLAVAGGMAAAESYALKIEDRDMGMELHSDRISRISDYKQLFQNGFLLQTEGRRHMIYYTVAPTAFLVAERKHGKGIYKQVLESKKPLDLLTDMVCGRTA